MNTLFLLKVILTYRKFFTRHSPSLPKVRRETYPLTFSNENRVTSQDWQQFINTFSLRKPSFKHQEEPDAGSNGNCSPA